MRHKLLKVYCFLIVLAVSTMILIWQFISIKEESAQRDYEEIRKEGVLRIGLEEGCTENNAYYFELSRHLSNCCKMEVQLQFFNTTEECVQALRSGNCDVVAPSINESASPLPASWQLREESVVLKDSIDRWLYQILKQGDLKRIKKKYFP